MKALLSVVPGVPWTPPHTRAHRAAAVALVLSGVTGLASAQGLTFTPAASIPGPVDLVRAQGQFLYAVASKELTIFDISNPSAPKRLGGYTLPQQVWGFRVAGDRAYVADGHAGIAILDISAPATPRLISIFKTPGQAKNVSVLGNRAFVANHNSGVDVIDISDPSKPKLLGSTDLDGYARDVVTFASFAVAVDNPSGVYVFDARGEAPLEPLATLQSATAPQQVEATEIAGARIAVLAGSAPYDPLRTETGKPRVRGGAVQLVDVSNPAAPVLTATHATAATGRRLTVAGSTVYVADGEVGLRVLDISTPSNPVLVSSHKTAKPARDVAVAGSLVFVALGGTSSVAGGTAPESGEIVILQQKR
jgi:hypothetical protein